MARLLAARHIVISALLVAHTVLGLKSLNCGNTKDSRHSWCDGYDINTDWYYDWPDKGVVREYWLSVENTTIAPDSVEVEALTFNGSLPGPTLVADRGDWFLIHVTNNLKGNGTSIHWHGIRQLHTNPMDGTPGTVQCPQAPGTTVTYEWQATQYGTTWYHSHFTVQYAAGLNGAIVINGPATLDYDIDIGAITLQDWFHGSPTAFGALIWDDMSGGPPTADGALINGTNIYPCIPSNMTCTSTGKRFQTTAQKRKTYRLRIINSSAQEYYRFTIDCHTFKIIANDLVPVVPYETDSLVIGEGERYDIVFEANQAVDNYWIRAMYQESGHPMYHPNNTLGILRYEGADEAAVPTSENPLMDSRAAILPDGPGYIDVLEPWVAFDVGSPALGVHMNVSADPVTSLWLINNYNFLIDYENPTIKDLANGEHLHYHSNLNYTDYQHQNKLPGWNLPKIYNGTDPTAKNIVRLPRKNQWVYFYINNYIPGENHPIHIHGHDFFILSQGHGHWDPANGTF